MKSPGIIKKVKIKQEEEKNAEAGFFEDGDFEATNSPKRSFALKEHIASIIGICKGSAVSIFCILKYY